ncbi:nuclear pore complex protein DDB_G0274915-like [Wyeomyia smithii]|uniref:nuclear pore complex protein DDB_G0274915-like n=1 Tax=Wyeomyia smithii TaxID=174621 RepID=UPI002467C154|nr:nuclear pore complex protein DDB_G0274915-like [Wyeomyia smithii]
MAIPFLQPEEDESARQHGSAGVPPASTGSTVGGGAGTSSAGIAIPSANVNAPVPMVATGSPPVGPILVPGSPSPSGTTTAVQTPLFGPMNGDHLVQLFYEALYRYSRGDTPSTPISQSPQSTSCSPFTTGYYSGQVFFPQTPNAVHRTPPGGIGGRGGVFFGLPTPSPSGSSSHSSQHSANSPDTPSCSSAIFHQFPTSFSTPSSGTSPAIVAASTSSSSSTAWNDEGDESSESDSSQPSSGCSSHCLGLPALHGHPHHDGSGSSSSSSVSGGTMGLMAPNNNAGFIPPHLDYMAGREQLQEFAGKIPQRKKKSKANKSRKSRFLEQTLVWPTLAVTATLIALGCGLLASR